MSLNCKGRLGQLKTGAREHWNGDRAKAVILPAIQNVIPKALRRQMLSVRTTQNESFNFLLLKKLFLKDYVYS